MWWFLPYFHSYKARCKYIWYAYNHRSYKVKWMSHGFEGLQSQFLFIYRSPRWSVHSIVLNSYSCSFLDIFIFSRQFPCVFSFWCTTIYHIHLSRYSMYQWHNFFYWGYHLMSFNLLLSLQHFTGIHHFTCRFDLLSTY